MICGNECLILTGVAKFAVVSDTAMLVVRSIRVFVRLVRER
jgi:hypothetical protein